MIRGLPSIESRRSEYCFPLLEFRHLNAMQTDILSPRFELRTPAEPAPPPIKEPTEPPENPDAPVREPDPEEPAQI